MADSMNTKHPAVSVTPAAPLLPTLDQTMALVCATTRDLLRQAVSEEHGDGQWDECFDHAQTLELIAEQAEHLAAQLPMPQAEFDEARWRIESAARLVRDSCPAKDTPAWRTLNAAARQMEGAGWLLECVKQASGASALRREVAP